MTTTPPTPSRPVRQPSVVDRFVFLIPIVFIALFIFGIPLGYKLVLGGKMSPLETGRIVSITLNPSGPAPSLEGREAKVLSDYLVVTGDDGVEIWIPRDAISRFDLKKPD